MTLSSGQVHACPMRGRTESTPFQTYINCIWFNAYEIQKAIHSTDSARSRYYIYLFFNFFNLLYVLLSRFKPNLEIIKKHVGFFNFKQFKYFSKPRVGLFSYDL